MCYVRGATLFWDAPRPQVAKSQPSGYRGSVLHVQRCTFNCPIVKKVRCCGSLILCTDARVATRTKVDTAVICEYLSSSTCRIHLFLPSQSSQFGWLPLKGTGGCYSKSVPSRTTTSRPPPRRPITRNSCEEWEEKFVRCIHGECKFVNRSSDGQRLTYCKCDKGWGGNNCQQHYYDAGTPTNHEGHHHEEAEEDHPLGPTASYKVAAIAIGVTVAVEVVVGAIFLLVMQLRSKKKEREEQVILVAAVNEKLKSLE